MNMVFVSGTSLSRVGKPLGRTEKGNPVYPETRGNPGSIQLPGGSQSLSTINIR